MKQINSTPQERLREIIDHKGVNSAEFSRLLGMPYDSSISTYLSEKRPVCLGASYREKLKNLGYSYEWYRTGRGSMLISDNVSTTPDVTPADVSTGDIMRLLTMPVFDVPVNALIGVGVPYTDLPVSYKPIFLGKEFRADTAVIFRITGNSLKDVGLSADSYLVVDTSQKEPVKNCTIVAQHNGVLIVKCFEITNDGKSGLYYYNGGRHEYKISPEDAFEIIGTVKISFQYL